MFSYLIVALFTVLAVSSHPLHHGNSSHSLSVIPSSVPVPTLASVTTPLPTPTTDGCYDTTSSPPATLTPSETPTTPASSTPEIPTTSLAPSPTSSASPTSSVVLTTVSVASSNGPFTDGFATYYYQNGNAGACGQVNPDSAFIYQTRFGTSGPASSLCGQKVQITNMSNGQTVTVTIADDCPTCANQDSIDLSVAAFEAISALSVGEVPTRLLDATISTENPRRGWKRLHWQVVDPCILPNDESPLSGSAICKAALARGIQVTSISSSGRPYKTPKGHTPAWVAKVEWRKADALLPETYSDILPKVGAVIHTLGTLLEDKKYKSALAHGDLISLVVAIAGGGGNPLNKAPQRHSYEVINRDSGTLFPETALVRRRSNEWIFSALRVCEAFKSSKPDPDVPQVRPFVYISAEDIYRPLIPAGYIETKREAEQRINKLLHDHPNHRGVFIRPSLVYHAHHRPLTSPLAALIDLSASIHASVPKGLPTPSSLLRAVGHAFPSSHGSPLSSPLHSIANALSIPPIHVEHVAEAICIALDPTKDVKGVIGVREMRELIGWPEKGQEPRLGRA
ncbi:hypothetical protein J3R83DRAFT_4855 [Lanmaoa asiatica]|nr:hypothetical protein J3R83DRAFT_4855 [Lanmaoa asiatica]